MEGGFPLLGLKPRSFQPFSYVNQVELAERKQAVLEELLKHGGKLTLAASGAAVGLSSIYRWMKADEAFRTAVKAAVWAAWQARREAATKENER